MAELAVNGGASTLSAALTSTATSLSIQTADEGKFPSTGTFAIKLSDGTNTELCEVTAVSGATFTVTRHSEPWAGSSTSYAFAATTTTVEQVPTVGTISGVLAGKIPSYDTTVLTKLSLAPVAYWKLNEPSGSTTAADSSGNGYTLTASGTVTFGVAGIVPTDSETCAHGDGSASYLTTTSSPALVPTSGAWTILFVAQVPTGQTGYMSSGNFGGTNGPAVVFEAGDIYAEISVGNAINFQTYPPVQGKSHVFELSYDGVAGALFVDGQPIANLPGAAAPASAPALLFCYQTEWFSSIPMGRYAIFANVLAGADRVLYMRAFSGVL